MKHRASLRIGKVVAVSRETIEKAARRVASCENCDKRSSTPFSDVLDDITGSTGIVHYLTSQARCPQCKRSIKESTLVETNSIDRQLKEFEPSPAQTQIVLVDDEVLLQAQSLLAGCEQCVSHAEIAFDYLLDAITGYDPTKIEYLLPRPARCPQCFAKVTEKTLVIS